MTPTEAYAFRIANESKIKAITGAVITTAAITAAVLIILSPILIPIEVACYIIKRFRK